MKNLPDNYDAIEEVEALIRKQTGDPQAGFNAGYFWLAEDGRRLYLRAEYRKKKGNDFTKKRYEMKVMAQFCPFTGKPLVDKGDDIKSKGDPQT